MKATKFLEHANTLIAKALSVQRPEFVSYALTSTASYAQDSNTMDFVKQWLSLMALSKWSIVNFVMEKYTNREAVQS